MAIILVSGLTMSFSQSAETAKVLQEYKQIVEENKSYRTYRAESGLRGNADYQFSDADGYRWYTSDHEGFQIYRFNGIKFVDMFAGEKSAAKDTMLPVLVKSIVTSTIYTAGIHNLYEWQNYNWKRYTFPKNDRILQIRENDGQVYCIGEKGVGILKQGFWVYRPFNGKITVAEASNAYVDKKGIVYSMVLQNQGGLTGDTSMYIKQFSTLKTTLMPIAQNLFNVSEPQICFDYRKEVMWIYLAKTELLYKYSLRNMLVQKVSLEQGERIYSISTTDKGTNWLITVNSGVLAAAELTAEYPQNKVMRYSSTSMSFNPAYLDYLYLENQLLPLSADDNLANSSIYNRIRIIEPNPQTRLLEVKELMNPLNANICKQVYHFGDLLLMDMNNENFRNVRSILALRYPFERFTQRDILMDADKYSLSYNEQMDVILFQRMGKISLVPIIIICEKVNSSLSPSHANSFKADSAAKRKATGSSKEPYIDDSKLHYLSDNTWHTLDIRKYEMHGQPANVIALDGILWLCFENALLRFDPKLDTSYTYTPQEGIPYGMTAVFAELGKLMISTKDATYKFTEYQNDLKVDIPYIIVSDSLKVSIEDRVVLPYTQRRLEIPISILGPLYPELCTVSYRLLGFSKDWVEMVYLERIRYLKLPYGAYTFEVSARAANGLQTSVKSFSFRIKPPWYFTWYAYVVYFLAGLMVFFLIYRWRMYRYRETNRQLELQVAERTHELQEWQLRMTQSIDYALLIQKSMLPQDDQLLRLFKEHFILWHPRDTVGGDLYWLHELPTGNAILFAVIDCTGHGVPGALVSMTVNSALNHIVKDQGINTPEAVLKQLHQDIGLTLHQESEKSQQDGLDIALIKVDFNSQVLSFAGAAMDILIYQPDSPELIVLKGSKYPIGGLKHRKNLFFEPQKINYPPNSKVYLFTDGILDQTYENISRMKRLGPEQWRNIIKDMGDKPLPEQKNALEELVAQMLKLDDQRDDITIVGLKL